MQPPFPDHLVIAVVDVLQSIHQLFAALVALQGIRPAAAEDQLLQAAPPQFRQIVPDRLHLKAQEGRAPAREQMKHGGPQGVDIRAPVRLPHISKLLRRRVAPGPQPGCVLLAGVFVFPRSPEVDQGKPAVGTQHDIGGLHVPVDDGRPAAVQVAQHITELTRPFQDLFRRLGPRPLQKVLKTRSLDIVHDDQEAVLLIDDIDNTGQVGMIQALEQVRLGDQPPRDGLCTGSAGLADLLDGPGLVGPLIDGQVDGAHAPAAYHVQYFVFSI